MKPFNLEKAKQDKPICTGKGKKARLICTDLKGTKYPVVAAVYNPNLKNEEIFQYTSKGKYVNELASSMDLFMADEEPKCPFKPFDKVLVRFTKGIWYCALFSNILEEYGVIYYHCNGIHYNNCIPYNEETEHLIGTTDAPPEKYVIW